MAFEPKLKTKIVDKKNLEDTKVDSNQIVASGKTLLVDSETVSTESGKPIHFARLSINDCLLSVDKTITDLPAALISEIFNFLDPKELGIVSCVTPSLYKIASDHHVWKQFYCERWGPPAVPISKTAESSNEKSWKELFVEREFRSKTFLGRYSLDTLYGHIEPVRTLFILLSKKLIFTSGYDSIVRMWDLEEGMSIASSRPLGCTIRAVSADSKVLIAGGSDGFIHGWRAEDGHPHLFNIKGPQNNVTEFRLWEHEGPITCVGLDLTRIYSGSWDMTIRVWDRLSLKCLNVLVHNDWVWALVPRDSTLVSTSYSDVYVWETSSFSLIDVVKDAHVGNAYTLARSHTGSFVFSGGEDGTIRMFEICSHRCGRSMRQVATWAPHSSPVNSLSFEFPWLVSASSDGKLSLIDVRKLIRRYQHSPNRKRYYLKGNKVDQENVEPPQRMLHGSGGSLFCVGIGCDRIISGGEDGTVRIWNFSQAYEIAKKVSALKALRYENRMRRRKLQNEMDSKGKRPDQCLIAAKNKRGLTRKAKGERSTLKVKYLNC